MAFGQYSIDKTPLKFEAHNHSETSDHHTTLAGMYALDPKKQIYDPGNHAWRTELRDALLQETPIPDK